MVRSVSCVIMVFWLTGCGAERGSLEVELTTQRLQTSEVQTWPVPGVESGQPEITVRQVFTAQGPCRELDAELLPRYPGEYMLRVVAEDRSPCDSEVPYIGYTARLSGLPPGTHQLRVVHVGANGRTLAEAVLEHPIVVTAGPR